MANYLVVLGGGKALRYGKDKLLEIFEGKRVLDILFEAIPWDLFTAVVWVGDKGKLSNKWLSKTNLIIADSGDTRFLSVKSGLSVLSIHNHDKVLIHDAARFLVSSELFERVLAHLDVCDVVYPSIKPSDALRYHHHDDIKTIAREHVYRVQTPQGFIGSVISDIVNEVVDNVYDEVMVAEKKGYRICRVPGEITNIKLTYPNDLKDIKRFFTRFESDVALGIGFDTHILGKGGTLYVGGVPVSHDWHSIGWSDGDALIHAVVDGILSAHAVPKDIGELFPPGDEKYKGVRSTSLLKEVIHLYGPVYQISAVVVLEKVKLKPYRSDIIEHIKMLTMADKVSVTFKTTEGMNENVYMAYALVSVKEG